MSTIEREVQSVPEVLTEREQRARTLEAAALEIAVRGHTRFTRLQDNGSVCLIGAIECAHGRDPGVRPSDALPCSFAGSVWDNGSSDWFTQGTNLSGWNDTYGRTADEVTFLLRWRAEEIRDGR